jgi:type VI secretion system protein ImpM
MASEGFFGKIPARGDFVRAGLPRSFTDPWDAWLEAVIAGSREVLGKRWLPAWMEAPIWHFALPAGQCGPAPVLGVWMPSVDAAGRHFPLTLARVGVLPADQAGWLTAAVAAGLRAQGFATVAGFEPGAARDEARRLGCSHVLEGGVAVAIEGT